MGSQVDGADTDMIDVSEALLEDVDAQDATRLQQVISRLLTETAHEAVAGFSSSI